MDGSGKTTISNNLKKVLEDNDLKVKTVYSGRGHGNIIPISLLGRRYYKIQSKRTYCISQTDLADPD